MEGSTDSYGGRHVRRQTLAGPERSSIGSERHQREVIEKMGFCANVVYNNFSKVFSRR